MAVLLPAVFDRFLDERPPGAPGADAHGLPWYALDRVPACSTARAEVEDARIVLERPRHGSVVRASVEHPEADVVEVVATTEGMPVRIPLDVLVDGRVLATLGSSLRGHVPIERGDHDIEVRPRDPSVAVRVARASISVR